ncbi:DGQHR domain-containing protein [Phragmitibacter flavus]|uniref:DGQHR domain-containing protein n=1 Tax=Phragmitibacter flavus TaxID=2576071 RepID=A0A5R8KDX1_9BACT|nr:DGQHR domain-containing protein [Phragmitibacter flavus]TLD70493.1 DGQHR domain-containing protein [Phragmitibacter flavus]
MNDESNVKIQIFTVKQPIGEFYVGVMRAPDLKSIAFADVRSKNQIEQDASPGIQRDLNVKRREEIKRYVRSPDASFPNSFILSVKQEDVVNLTESELVIRRHPNAASIIDGQHRLAGLENDDAENFDLIVSVFIDLPPEDQAMLFATINLKQTKVNESLVFDLFEESRIRSPQKTAHDVAKNLNRDSDSPFYREIKVLGVKTPEQGGRLTQATFVKRLLPLIAKDSEAVRISIKKKESLKKFHAENSSRIFWKFFEQGEDWAIQKTVYNFFLAVRDVFPQEWNSLKSPLARTIGFGALMRLLAKLGHVGISLPTGPRMDYDFFFERILRAKDLAPFSFDTYPASGTGETLLFTAFSDRVMSPPEQI